MTRRRPPRVRALSPGDIAAAVAAVLATAALVATPAFAAFTDTARSDGSSARAAAVFAPRNSAAPSIFGTPRDGRKLTAAAGTWNHQPDTVTIRWLRCDAAGASCSDIAGGATYTATGTDAGATLRVRVTATNAGGSAVATSAAVGPVMRSYPGEVLADAPSLYLRLDDTYGGTVGSGAFVYGSTAFSASGATSEPDDRAATFAPASALGASWWPIAGANIVELWCKGGTGVLLGTQSTEPFGTAPAYAPLLYVDTGGVLRAGMWDLNGGPRVITSGRRVDDGAWHHVALMRHGPRLWLTLDGQEVGAVSGSGSWSAQSATTIGSGVADGGWWPGTGATQQHWQHYTGQIDEVAAYPAALPQARLQAHIAAAR